MPIAAVTGAGGFIGSHVSAALIAAGWQVRGIDAFTPTYDPGRKRENLRPLTDPRFELVEADLGTADVDALLSGVDAVAHLAAEPGVGASWGQGFTPYVERNVLAMQRVLEGAARARVERFVYSSSSSVYGNGPASPLVETAALRPASPYGASKLMGELLLATYVDQRALPGVALRYFSVYGPRQRPDMAAHRFIEALLDGRPITLFGDGSQQRDFTYVDDVTAATLAALTADVQPGSVFNIAAGRPVAVDRLVRLLAELVDRDPAVVDRQPERLGDVDHTEGDTGAAARLLGWQPRTDLVTGLTQQVAWQRECRSGPSDGVAQPALAEAMRP